jgi:hypothetical protein
MVVKRSIRFAQRQADATETKLINRKFKDKERARRDARMTALLKTAKDPFPPAVLSWLSAKLNKKGSKITAADIKSLLAAAK